MFTDGDVVDHNVKAPDLDNVKVVDHATASDLEVILDRMDVVVTNDLETVSSTGRNWGPLEVRTLGIEDGVKWARTVADRIDLPRAYRRAACESETGRSARRRGGF